MKTILFTISLLVGLSASAQLDEQIISPAIYLSGSAAPARNALHMDAGVGFWWKPVGGFFVGYKNFGDEIKVPSKDKPQTINRELIVASYHARILIKETYLVSPYVMVGKNYQEAGIQSCVKLNPYLMSGVKAAINKSGSIYGLTVFAIIR